MMKDIDPDFDLSIFNTDHNVITPDEIKLEISKMLYSSGNGKEKGLFVVKTANQWIEDSKGKQIPRMLFDKFWFEGELCFLFADTNLGKSILAV